MNKLNQKSKNKMIKSYYKINLKIKINLYKKMKFKFSNKILFNLSLNKKKNNYKKMNKLKL